LIDQATSDVNVC